MVYTFKRTFLASSTIHALHTNSMAEVLLLLLFAIGVAVILVCALSVLNDCIKCCVFGAFVDTFFCCLSIFYNRSSTFGKEHILFLSLFSSSFAPFRISVRWSVMPKDLYQAYLSMHTTQTITTTIKMPNIGWLSIRTKKTARINVTRFIFRLSVFCRNLNDSDGWKKPNGTK